MDIVIIVGLSMNNKYTELFEPVQGIQKGTKIYRKGGCKILVSPPTEETKWHLSISRKNRLPSWNEVRDAWYDLVPDADNRTAAMMLPPKMDYINIHKYCFHVMEL